MSCRPLVLVLLLSSSLLASPAPPQSSAERTVPVGEEPHHKLILENDEVRVYDVTVPPGDSTLFHVHQHDYLYVVLDNARVRTEVLGQPPIDLPFERGQVNYTAGSITHRVINTGDTPFHNVTVELLKPRATGRVVLPPLTRDSTAVIALDNDRVRVTRQRIEPGKTLPLQVFAGHTLVIPATAGTLETQEPGKAPVTTTLTPGTVIWMAAPTRQTRKNTGTERLDIFYVELNVPSR